MDKVYLYAFYADWHRVNRCAYSRFCCICEQWRILLWLCSPYVIPWLLALECFSRVVTRALIHDRSSECTSHMNTVHVAVCNIVERRRVSMWMEKLAWTNAEMIKFMAEQCRLHWFGMVAYAGGVLCITRTGNVGKNTHTHSIAYVYQAISSRSDSFVFMVLFVQSFGDLPPKLSLCSRLHLLPAQFILPLCII